MKTILFLGGDKNAWPIVDIAAKMGLKTIVVDGNPNAYTRGNVFIEASCYHPDQVLSAINGFEIDAVLSAGTDTPHVMAAVAEARGIVGPSKWTAEHSIDKINQAELFSSHDILIPKYKLEDPYGLLDGPVVVKPADSRGARGVLRLMQGESWQEAKREAMKYSPTNRVIFQRWITGTQLSSESLVQDGKILWTAYSERNYDKLHIFAPHVIEDGGDMPPKIPVVYENDYEQICKEQLQKCVDALKFKTGTLKGDLVWDGLYCWVIEVATRLSGGGFCEPQIRLCWNVNFVKCAIKLALGEKLTVAHIWKSDKHNYTADIRPRFRNYVCQRYRFPKSVTMHPERGDYVIATGGSREEARMKAQEMLI